MTGFISSQSTQLPIIRWPLPNNSSLSARRMEESSGWVERKKKIYKKGRMKVMEMMRTIAKERRQEE